MPTDRFESYSDAPSGPARQAFAVAPNDNVELAILPKAILAGSARAITLRAVEFPG